jgi:hypothetical protein
MEFIIGILVFIFIVMPLSDYLFGDWIDRG